MHKETSEKTGFLHKKHPKIPKLFPNFQDHFHQISKTCRCLSTHVFYSNIYDIGEGYCVKLTNGH
jgi:hypothetical protein